MQSKRIRKVHHALLLIEGWQVISTIGLVLTCDDGSVACLTPCGGSRGLHIHTGYEDTLGDLADVSTTPVTYSTSYS